MCLNEVNKFSVGHFLTRYNFYVFIFNLNLRILNLWQKFQTQLIDLIFNIENKKFLDTWK